MNVRQQENALPRGGFTLWLGHRMSDEAKPAPEEDSEEVHLRPAGDEHVKHRKEATPAPPEKIIHPRRPLPPVPEKPPDPEKPENPEE
jgi:hypothetical protein